MRTKNQPLWDLAEQRGADYFNAERVRGSGQGWRKSDFRQVDVINGVSVNKVEGYRGEVKSSEKPVFVINTNWFGKITKEAFDQKQIPCLFFQCSDLKAFALIPEEELPKDNNVLELGLSSTSVTSSSLNTFTHVKVPVDTFEKYNCGANGFIPLWRLIPVDD